MTPTLRRLLISLTVACTVAAALLATSSSARTAHADGACSPGVFMALAKAAQTSTLPASAATVCHPNTTTWQRSTSTYAQANVMTLDAWGAATRCARSTLVVGIRSSTASSPSTFRTVAGPNTCKDGYLLAHTLTFDMTNQDYSKLPPSPVISYKHVQICVTDVYGRTVSTVVNGKTVPACSSATI